MEQPTRMTWPAENPPINPTVPGKCDPKQILEQKRYRVEYRGRLFAVDVYSTDSALYITVMNQGIPHIFGTDHGAAFCPCRTCVWEKVEATVRVYDQMYPEGG